MTASLNGHILTPVSLLQATPDQCRWIAADPRHMIVCGLPVVPGRSYCAEHARLAIERKLREVA